MTAYVRGEGIPRYPVVSCFCYWYEVSEIIIPGVLLFTRGIFIPISCSVGER